MVVLSTLKEAYRDVEEIVEEKEITREPAKKVTAGEEAAEDMGANDKAAKDKAANVETAAVDVELEIVKAPKEAWKKLKDKIYWFKIIGETPS